MKKITALVFCCCWQLAAPPLQAKESTETAADVLRLALPAAAYGLTFLHDDPEGRPQFYKSFLTTTAATYLLKVAIDAEGPGGESRSFPSGHTAMAFSGASFMHKRYGWKYGAPAYLAASFVGWSRIDSDDHEILDVLAGAALGTACTFLFTDRFEKQEWRLVPVAAKTTMGVKLEGSW